MIVKKIIFLFLKFLIEEIKILRTKVINFLVYFHEFNVLYLFLEKIFINKKFNTFRINDINNFINHNKKIYCNSNKKNNSQKKIFVESFINHPIYTIQNCIIASTVSKILKQDCCGILRKGDIKSKKIFNSFGINEIIYINQGNILLRFFNLMIAFKLLNKVKSIESLIKLKFENIEIGRATYDQYLRFKKNPEINKIVIDFYFYLSQALIYNNQFKKIFQKYKNTYLIQSETQYFPHSLCMSNAIKFNHKMISRRGEISQIGLKIFSKKKNNFKENRNRPSKEIFDFIYKKLKKNNLLESDSKKFFKLNIGKEIFQLIKKDNKLKLFQSKKDVCEYFNFNYKKPIVLILAHELSDGNMNNSWNLFNNDFIWLEETIEIIKKIKNINWIIKSHPSENIYNNKVKTTNVYEKLANGHKNITLFPNNYNVENFYKFISVAISSHGSAGYEYPLKSIPTIICGESTYSGFGFNIEPKSKTEYFNILKKIHKIKKLDSAIVKKCFAFNYLFKYVSLEPIPITFETNIAMNFDKKYFWKKTFSLTKKNGIFNRSFEKSLTHQLSNNNSYYINLVRLNNLKKKYKSNRS